MQNSCDCSQNNQQMFQMNMGNPQHQINGQNRLADRNIDVNMNNLTNALGMNQNPLMQQQNNAQMQQQNNAPMQQQNNAPMQQQNNAPMQQQNVAKKQLISSLGIVSNDNTISGTVKDSYYILLKNINLAFILVAAFAWNDAVKFYIAKLIRNQQGSPYYYLYYALIVTLLAVISVRLTRRFLIGN